MDQRVGPLTSVSDSGFPSERTVKGCIRMDHLINDSMYTDLKIYNINDKIIEYENKRKNPVERINENRLSRKL